MNPEMMSEHQQRVAEFMLLAKQELPTSPVVPSEEVRRLRATLILEEALETVDALGFAAEIVVPPGTQTSGHPIFIAKDKGPNLRDIADGCADISVVTIGTLLACGIADKPLLEEVDRSNLAKFELPKCPNHPENTMKHRGVGEYQCNCGATARGPYRREDGKWIKGPDWKIPDIDGAICKSDDPSLAAMTEAPTTVKAWTADEFTECKNQLIAFHEFEVAEKLVAAIQRMQSGEPPPKSYIEAMTNGLDVERVYCNHCRGMLSQKLVKDMHSEARRGDIFRCPDCMNLLNSKDLIHAKN